MALTPIWWQEKDEHERGRQSVSDIFANGEKVSDHFARVQHHPRDWFPPEEREAVAPPAPPDPPPVAAQTAGTPYERHLARADFVRRMRARTLGR